MTHKCQKENCETSPSFNLPGEKKGIYCAEHKENGMVNVVSRKCQKENCNKQSLFNFPEEKKGIYCFNHKEDGMVDVVHKKCQTLLCDIRVSNPKYKNYCLRCFIYIFPDEPITRNYKTKEKAVSDYIQTEFFDEKWVYDKQTGGCSKRRPDILLDLYTKVIIIEIDENQHTNYDCSCENKRLMELSQDMNFRPIIFIRFNPDSYILKNGKKVLNPWSVDKKSGIIKVSKTQEKNWKNRLKCLRDQIKYWIKNDTDKTIEIIQLFYDENL
jgi:hypothetical protein